MNANDALNALRESVNESRKALPPSPPSIFVIAWREVTGELTGAYAEGIIKSMVFTTKAEAEVIIAEQKAFDLENDLHVTYSIVEYAPIPF